MLLGETARNLNCYSFGFPFLVGLVPDVYLVPVSYSYEKVLDQGIAEELLGKEKKRESLWGIMKSVWRALGSHYGFVRVDIASPVSLKV